MSASESSSAVAPSDGSDAPAGTGTQHGTQPGNGLFLRPAPIAIEQGYVLASRYEVERPLGRGATGVVLQAYDRVIRSPIAVKILNPELAADPKWIERLEAELRHGRRIVDPHVCRVFDIGQADGHHFLTMELASGGSLRQRLRMEGRAQTMREAEAREVVAGLAAIHAAGMVHRDVKPENVLCRENGQLMVSDFGLAVTPGQTTYHSGAAGTPSYMAPEVMLAEKATFASDVWSLGVVLHEIWFGKRPEWTTTAHGRFLKLPIDGTSQAVDRAMANLCASCLEELPPRRYQDALIVQRELARALTGRSTRRRHGRARLRWWWTAGALVVVGGAGLVGLSQRPAPLRPLPVTGTPADWLAGSRLLARFVDPVACLMPARRPGAVWVITRGSSGGAQEIDLASGKSTPAPLPPETYASGCPHPQPDGPGLAYSASDPTTKLRQVMLLPTGVADEGKRTLALSGVPLRWLSPQDLLYSLDPRRAAVLSRGQSNLLPDPPGTATLMSTAVNRRGTELALVFRDRGNTSVVQRLAFPTLEKLDVMEVDGSVFGADYDGRTGGLLLALGAPYWRIVAELSPDGKSLRARGRIERAHVERLLTAPAGLVFTTTRVHTKVLLQRPDGTTAPIATGRLLSNPTVSTRGDVLLLERLSDGRGVVVYQRHTDSEAVQLTQGPQDMAPALDPDGRAFVYVRADRNEVVRCLLDEAAGSSCEVMDRGEQQLQTASVSADGRFVVYVAATRTGARLGSLDRTTKTRTDLGPAGLQCRIRWSSLKSFWFYQTDKQAWTEATLPEGQPTGRIVSAPQAPCATELPGTPKRPFNASLEQSGGTELRLVPL